MPLLSLAGPGLWFYLLVPPTFFYFSFEYLGEIIGFCAAGNRLAAKPECAHFGIGAVLGVVGFMAVLAGEACGV